MLILRKNIAQYLCSNTAQYYCAVFLCRDTAQKPPAPESESRGSRILGEKYLGPGVEPLWTGFSRNGLTAREIGSLLRPSLSSSLSS